MSSPKNLVIINSNLAIPASPHDPNTFPNPVYEHLDLDEQARFQGAQAFQVPDTIKLRLYDGSELPYEDELCERIRRLGHGVDALIERDGLSTMIGRSAIQGKGPYSTRTYAAWHITGLATIPRLGLDVHIGAIRVVGHKTHPNNSGRVDYIQAI